jgi:phospholipase/lecithinase/hemolysin
MFLHLPEGAFMRVCRKSLVSCDARRQMTGGFLAMCAAAMAITPLAVRAAAPADAPAQVSGIIAFGDSYLDNGALLRLTRAAMGRGVPGARPMPGEPSLGVYPVGRWTNGPTAIELLAGKLGVPLTDYTLGGAKSGDGNYDPWLDAFADSGLWGQVEDYRSTLAGQAPDAGTVFLVAVSANDYLQFHDFHQAQVDVHGRISELSVEALAARVARNTGRAVRELVALGARRIVVCGAYLLEAMPAVALGAPGQDAEARRFRDAYDRSLVEQIAPPWPAGVHIARFDWAAVTARVIRQSQAFGFDNVTRPCQRTLPAPTSACTDPEKFLWWDEWHETAHMHRIVAEHLGEAFAAVLANP